MSREWSGVWERLLAVLLTANIAVMGWLWANVARLADRLDRHSADRSIHQAVDVGQLVGQREFEVSRENGRTAEAGMLQRLARLEEKVDRIAMRRLNDED